MSNKAIPHIALIIVSGIYGANHALAKLLMGPAYMHPYTVVMFRILCGCLIFHLLGYLRTPEKVLRKHWMLIFFCGLTGVFINQFFFFTGLNLTKPINASLIMVCVPALVFVMSVFILNEVLTKPKVLGMVLSGIGAVLLITFGKTLAFSSDQLLGDLLVLINAISYAIYLVIVKELIKQYHAITVARWIFSVGLVFIIPFGMWKMEMTQWSTMPLSAWLVFLYIIFAVTILAYFLNLFALQKVSPSIVAVYIYLQPLVASICSILLGMEQLQIIQVVSGILIFLGLYLVSIYGKREKKVI